MNYRLMIVDDELASRTMLHGLVTRHCPDVVIAAMAGSVSDAETVLRRDPIDLLLLDVQMEDGTGFDLLDRFSTWSFNVIFTTAHDEFAVRAFRYHAIDYLLKPIVPEELVDAIGRAGLQTDHQLRQQQITQLLETTSKKTFDRITLNTTNGPVFLQTKDILRLETYGNYCFVFFSNGERHLVSRNLKEFEEMLPEPDFFRIHQSHMINTSYVQKFIKDEGGHAIMKDGAKLPVARRRKEDFLDLLRK